MQSLHLQTTIEKRIYKRIQESTQIQTFPEPTGPTSAKSSPWNKRIKFIKKYEIQEYVYFLSKKKKTMTVKISELCY